MQSPVNQGLKLIADQVAHPTRSSWNHLFHLYLYYKRFPDSIFPKKFHVAKAMLFGYMNLGSTSGNKFGNNMQGRIFSKFRLTKLDAKELAVLALK